MVIKMAYCAKCKVTITGNPRRCPLCQGDLIVQEDGVSQETFPAVPAAVHPHRTLIRLIAFATVVAAAVSIAVNLSVPTGEWWSLFVLAGLASLWLSVMVVMKKRNNIPKNIIWQVVLISLLALAWDWFTGYNGWSVDYVLPILCACAMIAMAVAARILHLRIEDYIIYLIIDSIFGILPLTLILCGVVEIVYPSAICVAVSMVSLGGLLLFEGNALRAEIIRRMHM